MENHSRSLSTDELLEIAADQTRRIVLSQLIEEGESRVQVEELVSTVCAETGPTVGEHPTGHETVRTRLHHRHLPKLAAAGVIEYEEDRHCVRYHPNERLEALLDFLEERG
ncbi:DUF7344 domain-containing protein [Halobacterium wangiae]|uniref:DUF7344 domain-containing protein n=1 Tax=Halobacterium wangiae TaxID=2902623 RepID=UPI001E32A361|nr:hypothetical protein [Halobacterium wangiae]